MNRVECLPLLLVSRSLREAAERALGMDGFLVVCGAVTACVFYAVACYVYRRRRHFQNYVDMIYFMEVTSKIDPDRCQNGFLLKVGSMFGPLYAEYVHGSALRTWNCVARFVNVVWYKVNHLRDPIMPRSRRRHHSRSRSRSRSHSHDRDRDAKRRKVDSYDSPHHRRSVSSEPEDRIDITTANCNANESANESVNESCSKSESDVSMLTAEEGSVETETPKKTPLKTVQEQSKKLTPKQIEKRNEVEKKRQEKLEEKEKKKQEANKMKQLKDEQKQKEKEDKLKEKEKMLKEKEEKKKEKEVKKKEKEEKEELKRKEKEQEKLEKQQKIDEKNKEKQRMEEAKLKAAAAFTKFFKKLPDSENEKLDVVVKGEGVAFMPFEKKADMKLAPITRRDISAENRDRLEILLEDQHFEDLYLKELKGGKEIGRSGKTWPKQEESEDVVIIGETIEEEKHKIKQMRAKYLHFRENQRPAYYGTFRKKSPHIGARKPFGKDGEKLDYEADSDEEWEEEPEGESLEGTDDEEEDKENDGNDDYEVDNDFFVPHGHLSEDEVDDEAERRLDPEMHKAKLKLLKNEFEEERKSKTQKIRPVIVGGYWQGKMKDEIAKLSINKYLAPYTFIRTNGAVSIKERSSIVIGSMGKRKARPLDAEHVPMFLKFVHGSSKKGKELVKKFIEDLEGRGIEADVSQMAVGKQLRKYAEWTNREEGVKRRCWIVREYYQKKFNLDLAGGHDMIKKDSTSNTP